MIYVAAFYIYIESGGGVRFQHFDSVPLTEPRICLTTQGLLYFSLLWHPNGSKTNACVKKSFPFASPHQPIIDFDTPAILFRLDWFLYPVCRQEFDGEVPRF